MSSAGNSAARTSLGPSPRPNQTAWMAPRSATGTLERQLEKRLESRYLRDRVARRVTPDALRAAAGHVDSCEWLWNEEAIPALEPPGRACMRADCQQRHARALRGDEGSGRERSRRAAWPIGRHRDGPPTLQFGDEPEQRAPGAARRRAANSRESDRPRNARNDLAIPVLAHEDGDPLPAM